MKKIIIPILLFIILNNSFAQKITISGYIKDSKTGEKLIGVGIYDSYSKTGTVSNNFGFYSLQFDKSDSLHLKISFVGYNPVYLTTTIDSDLIRNFSLKEGYQIDEVSVSAQSEHTSDFNVVRVPLTQIENLPSLTGEKDILKAYTLLPGVQSGNEGSSELYVRGGSPDQNLILLDDVPVYYLNHLGGFLSIFDENAVKSMSLLKGGFPARYGGRLSSVVDIRLKEGNTSEFGGELSVGLISSRLSLEGPFINKKTTYIFSARRCNLDYISRLFFLLDPEDVSAGYTFYDINAKVSHRFSENSQISALVYQGRDKLFINVADDGQDYNNNQEGGHEFWNKNQKKWGNLLTSLQWNYGINKKLYVNTTLAYTRYKYYSNIGMQEDFEGETINKSEYENFSSVGDYILKSDFDYFINSSNQLKFGLKAIAHKFEPGSASYTLKTEDYSNDTLYGNQTLRANEYAAYIEDNIKIGEHFNANLGLHYAAYSYNNEYEFSLQPRLNINVSVNQNNKFNLSYAAMSQFIHLLSSSGAGVPTGLWVPVSNKAPYENSIQYALGYSHFFTEEKLKFSFEAFYKQMDNLIEIKNETNFFLSEGNWDDKIETNGVGEVYGAEFLLQKSSGDLTGWIAYTWSKNIRQFENLNSGETYYFNYDRRHDISIVANYKLKKNIRLSASWVFSTGNPITLGFQKFDAFELIRKEPSSSVYDYTLNEGHSDVYYYTEKNSYRMRTFHKLDLALNIDKKVKKGIRTWSFGLYNAYCRQNSYYVYINKNYEGEYSLKSFTLLPIIPSFSYSLKF